MSTHDSMIIGLRRPPSADRFIGELSGDEFGDTVDHFLLLTAATEHAHNSFICAIIHNATRDVPDPGTAAWVSAATDKAAGTVTSKPAITSDAAEQRLKTEIKQIARRDKNRIKAFGADKSEDDSLRRNTYEDQYNASRIKAPHDIPTAPGGITKTNWELEIKKRYQQPLYSEAVEFPDANSIFARMVPICYEEAVASGSSVQAAEYVGFASEIFLKDFLSGIFNRTRANGPRYEPNVAAGGVLTGTYKKQVLHEEAEAKDQRLKLDGDTGLLPVEARAAIGRRPLAINDLKLAGNVTRGLWNGMPTIGRNISEASLETEQEEWRAERKLLEAAKATSHFQPTQTMKTGLLTNGITTNGNTASGDSSGGAAGGEDDHDDNYGWEGTGAAESEALNSLLQGCLAIRT